MGSSPAGGSLGTQHTGPAASRGTRPPGNTIEEDFLSKGSKNDKGSKGGKEWQWKVKERRWKGQ